jgi:hypothetical protein
MASIERRWWWIVHNVVAHPLLILWPRIGVRLHDWTGKKM